MSLHAEQGGGVEWLDWLFDQNDGILRHEEEPPGNHGNQLTWLVQDSNMFQPVGQPDNEFLTALLSGEESASGSPLWSPSPSDSGISEDPASDQMDSPRRPGSPSSAAAAARYIRMAPVAPTGKAPPRPPPPVSLDLNGWAADLSPGETDRTPYPPPTTFPLTVKDLLLSGTQEPPQPPSQQSVQELVLNDDEKKLLVKEGVSLPTQLPLTKHEERILKKIRRKIRNKQSAQESRKKKKEYVDGLESRMSTYNSHNQELQRKVYQLEKCNTSLMEQLRRLQALVMNATNKPVQAGTCVLVLLLSFSLILFPTLRPFPDAKVSQGDFGPVRVQSRTLHSLQASGAQRAAEPPLPLQTAHGGVPPPGEMGEGELGHGPSDSGFVAPLPPPLRNHSLKGEGPLSSFPGDPITGHMGTVTLDPYHRPHADDM